MPVISTSSYQAPFLYSYNHFNTIYPALFRKVEVDYYRRRIDTPDGDFLDLDFRSVAGKTGVILLHGLEGSSDSVYIKGLVKAINKEGWDAIAVNFRGCSGEPNRLVSAYHSGITQDLKLVVEHLATEFHYQDLHIVGFSLGGNVTLKFVGEEGANIHPKVRSAIGVSVPTVLGEIAVHLDKRSNMMYLQSFLSSLREKTKIKMVQFPEAPIEWEKLLKVKNFEEFDDLYTGPVHGFENGQDYYTKCSSRQFLPGIKIPTLLINAQDDPFLTEGCHPFEEAEASEFFYFESPTEGGHVGFVSKYAETGEGWLDKRVIEFFQEHL